MSLTSAVRRGACALALLLALVGLARADEPPPPRDARSSAEDEHVAGEPVELPEQVIRLPGAEPTDPTSSATVVRAEAFAGEAKAVAELVGTAPGVAVRDQGGLGQLATVSIRGASAAGVRVLLDGLPLNTGAGGGVDLSRIPRHWVSSLEVVRGAEGARFGAGALGGVLNVVTRPAGGDAWSAELGGGSFRTYTAGADLSTGGDGWGLAAALSLDGTRGDFSYVFDRTPNQAGGTRERTRRHNGAAAGGLLAKGFLRDGGGRWDALLQLSGGAREIPGDPRLDAAPALDAQRDARAALAVRHARPGPLGTHTAATLSLRADGLTVLAPGDFFDSAQRGQAASLRLEASGVAGRVSLEGGLSAGGERLAGTGLGEARSRGDVALWTALELPLLSGRLRVAPAVRAEVVGPFRGLSAKLGGALALWGPLSLRASAGRTFRPPSFSELHLTQAMLRPNPGLVPERAVSADVAIAAEGRRGLLSLTAFASEYDDLVIYVPLTFQTFGPRNDAHALVRGLEAEAALAPAGPFGLSAQAAATLQDARTLRGLPEEVGRALPRKPGLVLFARVGARRGPVEGHLELHHVGEQWLDTRQLRSIAPATTANAGVGVRVVRRPEVRLHLEVRNLTNLRIMDDGRTLEDGFANPLPGRMVMLTLRAGSDIR